MKLAYLAGQENNLLRGIWYEIDNFIGALCLEPLCSVVIMMILEYGQVAAKKETMHCVHIPSQDTSEIAISQ